MKAGKQQANPGLFQFGKDAWQHQELTPYIRTVEDTHNDSESSSTQLSTLLYHTWCVEAKEVSWDLFTQVAKDLATKMAATTEIHQTGFSSNAENISMPKHREMTENANDILA